MRAGVADAARRTGSRRGSSAAWRRRADVVFGATLPIAEDLARRLGADAHWVTNGFEPELESVRARAARATTAGGRSPTPAR